MTPKQKKKIFAICFVVGMVGGYYYYQSFKQPPNKVVNASPTNTEQTPNTAMTMSNVLDMAKSAKEHLSTTLDDYTARFVKQELDSN